MTFVPNKQNIHDYFCPLIIFLYIPFPNVLQMSSTSVTFLFNALNRMAHSTSLISLLNEEKSASPGVCVSMWCYVKELDKVCM